MPNRILKDSIRTSKKVNDLSDFNYRIWSYLITYVDDYGRGSADPELLKGLVFPRRKGLTEAQISKALDDLANTGMIKLYEVDGESYLYFPNWDMHQQIRAKKSKFPAPANENIHVISDDINGNHMISCDSICSRNPIQSESESNPSINRTDRARESEAWRVLIPTREEVRAYAAEIQSKADPDQFFDYFSAGDWHDRNGDPVRNWRQKFAVWNNVGNHSAPQRGEKKSLTFYDVAQGMKARGEF